MIRSTNSYFGNITLVVRSLAAGLRITIKHLFKARRTQPVVSIQAQNYFDDRTGIATIQYPYEMQPVPDNGRYRLHNEIDDCIVCDKCAKICPVDCIEIEPVRAIEEIGKTSDGTSKRIYAAKFDIDMGKCCFCGLCTTVCPTECLTMTKVYDFSVTDIREHNFEFGDMSDADIADKKRVLDEYLKAKAAPAPKEAAVSGAPPVTSSGESAKANDEIKSGDAAKPGDTAKPVAKPVFKPRIKPPSPPSTPS
ncbi:MAG: 4Fe-4S dicluster domain-containing protein [Chryseolinea sp.]